MKRELLNPASLAAHADLVADLRARGHTIRRFRDLVRAYAAEYPQWPWDAAYTLTWRGCCYATMEIDLRVIQRGRRAERLVRRVSRGPLAWMLREDQGVRDGPNPAVLAWARLYRPDDGAVIPPESLVPAPRMLPPRQDELFTDYVVRFAFTFSDAAVAGADVWDAVVELLDGDPRWRDVLEIVTPRPDF